MAHTLDSITRMAQATANRDSKPVAVLNLNQYAPLYVVRDYVPGMEAKHGFVKLIVPHGDEWSDAPALSNTIGQS